MHFLSPISERRPTAKYSCQQDCIANKSHSRGEPFKCVHVSVPETSQNFAFPLLCAASNQASCSSRTINMVKDTNPVSCWCKAMPKQEFLIVRKYFLSICICSIACIKVQVNLQQLQGTKKFSLRQIWGHKAILYSNCFFLI